MDVYADLAEVARTRAPLHLAIGAFDGVHLGHQAVIRAARAEAGAGASGVLTFDPDPAHVIAPETAPPVITPTPRKLEILRAMGLDVAVVLPFTPQLARESPETFVDGRLAAPGTVRAICVGRDFRYGRGASGDVDSLRAACGARQIRVRVVPPVTLDGDEVSSSRIRSLVAAGDLDDAGRLLGRPFSVWGRVERGTGLGTTIGFPTANIVPGDHLAPPNGVYAAATRVGDTWHGSAVNIGVRPTIGDRRSKETVMETHILDFEGDLEGRPIEVLFGPRIRDEIRFDALPALRRRIAEDIGIARRWWERNAADGARGASWTPA